MSEREYALPKSLRGTEDADLVWNMITERFPNAAPLLCEMEAVIERAEDLLHQLREPSHREIALETSASFCAQDSEDSISLMSAQDFLVDEHAEAGDKETKNAIAETQMSESSVYESETNFVHSAIDRDSKSSDEKIGMPDKTVDTPASSKPEEHPSKATKEATSLEQWDEVISNALGERVDSFEKSPTIPPPEKENSDVGDFAENQNEDARNEDTHRHVKDANVSLKGCGDEGPATFSRHRRPLEILEEYAKRCEVPIVYQYHPHRHKSAVHVIRGNLGGFAATSRGESEDNAKDSLATKILLMLADHQMNDEKFVSLSDLSKDEMQEIMDLGTGNEKQTAQAKLYRLSLEQGATVPKYTIEKIKTYQGFTYVATCNALGLAAEGRGLRECVAKKAAAEELCRQCTKDSKL